MTSPPNERSRPGAGAAPQKISGWRSENHSRTVPRQSNVCHADEYGQLDLGCLREILDAEERAYVRGFRAGLEQNARDVWAEVQHIARNVASDPSRTWSTDGGPQRRPWPWRAGEGVR